MLIGITGRKQSGKNTLAARLVAKHDYTEVAFADPMREMALALDPLIDGPHRLSELVTAQGWDVAKESCQEVRRTLQRLGTEAGRTVLGENVWVDAAMSRVDAIAGPVAVTDVRFPNEADAIRAAGGIIVRVTRPDQTLGDAHLSETSMDGYPADVTVTNDGTVEQLWAAADVIARG